MDTLALWKLCDEYSIIQATLLACGYDPDELQWEVERNWNKRPPGYSAIKTAIENAVRTGTLPAKVSLQIHEDYDSTSLDLNNTLIAATDLDAFFRAKGHSCEYFERDWRVAPARSLSPAQSNYPRKLDAALKAWTAVSADPSLLRGKSPKQALTKWLTDHAAELGLLNRDETINKGGIEEICKVANWRPEGGAVPTPSAQLHQPLQPPLVLQPLGRSPPERRPSFSDDLDDEIPF